MTPFKKIGLAAATAAALLVPAMSAMAQTYPVKAIRMIVGFPPGGSSDIAARIFADRMSRELGQSIVVDNRAGVGGNIAAAELIRAEPDGYTMLYATSSIVLGPLLYPSVKFDPLTDFTPVALTATNPLVFVVNAALPPKNLKEFISYAKTQKNLNYASTGAGTMTHLPGAAFTRQFNVDAAHVPYKGASPAMVDLGSGSTQFMISALSEAQAMLREGRIRPLAITSAKRNPLFPDLPTFNESLGTTDWVMGGWQGIVLPKGASPDIVKKLEAAVNKAIADPAVKAKFAPQGTELLGGTSAQFTQFMKTETPRWKKIIDESGAKVE
ncbi:MAG: tripartite tricarboxylate transporter substrate binding protein [Haliea sp.]|nr:MAG: tripartite tricarboxylate transporter substrate binding protein [Haliea sp.]